jgi:hypothetical protein
MSSKFWKKPNNVQLALLEERVPAFVPLPIVSSLDNVEVKILGGRLPPGTRLENNTIIGRPFEVRTETVFKVAFRASMGDEFEDRTFKFVVVGSDEPQWVTSSGLLPIGNNNRFFVLDNQFVDFKLFATDSDTTAGDTLEYFIARGDGVLPPGLILSKDGSISGITEPLISLQQRYGGDGYDAAPYDKLPLDFGQLPSSGFDTYLFDSTPFGFFDVSLNVRKLNRYFPFVITVTDGRFYVKREFEIFLVGDDFLRSDNSIMKSSSNIFSADVTFTRTPFWLTPSNLGRVRADNFLFLKPQVIDTPTLSGKVIYTLEDANDDSTASKLPPGMQLDSNTGIIYGRVPYQPAVAIDHKFTLRATRFEGRIGRAALRVFFLENYMIGTSEFRAAKISGDPDAVRNLIGRRVLINEVFYRILNIDTSSSMFDTVYLDSSLVPLYNLITTRKALSGNNYAFVERLDEVGRAAYQNRSIAFPLDSNNRYDILDIVPYLEYEIEHPNLTMSANDFEIDEGDVPILENIQGSRWRLKIRSTAKTRRPQLIINIINSINPDDFTVSLIRDNEDKIVFGRPLDAQIIQGKNISIAAFQGDSFIQEFPLVADNDIVNPSSTKTFTVTTIGEIESAIFWKTSPNLGTLRAGLKSTLQIQAESSVRENVITYRITNGRLPFGLTLTRDGLIVGEPRQYENARGPGLTRFDGGNITWDTAEESRTTFDRSFNFTVEASDRSTLSADTRQFTLVVDDSDPMEYTDVFIRPLPKVSIRAEFFNFINNPRIFTPSSLYRAADPRFGVQRRLESLMYAGVQLSEITKFVVATSKNFKRRSYMFGEVKSLTAKIPGTNTILYEVVYVELKDRNEPTAGETVDMARILTSNNIKVDSRNFVENINSEQFDDVFKFRVPISNQIKVDSTHVDASQNANNKIYLSNITKMRNNISNIGTTNFQYLPLWMRSPQDDLTFPGYSFVVPLCYCIPGTANDIILNINNSGFDFKQINYDIDRIYIKRTTDDTEESFILFPDRPFNNG